MQREMYASLHSILRLLSMQRDRETETKRQRQTDKQRETEKKHTPIAVRVGMLCGL